MAARLTRLLVALGLLLGVALPSAAAAVVRPPTSQETAASLVPARGVDPAYARSYFGARYYRADIGRFTTVDPKVNIKDALVEPQRWNRYAYVTNNPLRYVDPDGRDRMGMYQPGQRGEAAPWRGLWQEVKSIGAVAAGFAAPLFAPELATAAVGCFLSPACQQNALEMIAPEGSPSINPGAASSGVGAVIGHFDAGYAKVGRELRTAVFDIPKEIWDRLTPEQRTRANQVFLDAVIERGAVIKVVTNGPVRIPSTLAWEIDYLLTRGYRWNEAGDKLLPPVK